ncbi:hypothetical protein B0T24DRAFT_679075 [Lasiosphaeria ovina]|uniref:Protein kinase domain-containing protein n=1 Tax=Lasiosphaeria ovina TaxID=92902 RepID=A0AAE0N871_9PEZI|nr:hypothetical protein B0T24DRAFT_679075 [Lasiosphaeria ovina]
MSRHPLNNRVHLAKRIASGLFILHSADLVHKIVRPDNIVLLDRESRESGEERYPWRLGEPFRVGFNVARRADAASLMLRTEEWRRNIYLSPERQRLQHGDHFRAQHDLYSLGVVLLEISFWSSFQDSRSENLGSRVWKKERVQKTEPSAPEYKKVLRTPEELRDQYLLLATRYVPRLMGQKFADVIVSCLNGLKDKAGTSALEDLDGIVVGSAYLTHIIRKLEQISL